MKQLFGVLGSDSVNKYGMKFPIGALESALAQAWFEGRPTNIGHDVHKPIGWTHPVGLYIEPGLARLVGRILIPENEVERERLHEVHRKHISERNRLLCAQGEDSLRKLLDQYLSSSEQLIYTECVAVCDKGIAIRVFPEIFSQRDRDGLTPLSIVLQYFEPIGPGVFRAKGKDLALFVHPYFRKSLSRLNSYNKAFLERIIDLIDRNDLSIRLGFDSDMLGYAPTYQQRIELEYWWGPKFSDDIATIQPGVTVHASTDYQRLFHGISKTEFWWKSENSTRVFEAEELKEIPAFGIGEDQIGCRYTHAMIDVPSGVFCHFDGAIRMYPGKDMVERLQRDIRKAGKKTKYTKLFRLDGHLSVSEWKSLVSDYFQGNPLVVEYLGESREPNLEPVVLNSEEVKSTKYSFCPYSLDKGMGVRLMISYHPVSEEDPGEERWIECFDYIRIEGRKFGVVEYDIIELKKAFQRLGRGLQIPADTKLVTYEDLYLCLPIVRHSREHLPENLRTTIQATKMIIDGLVERGAGHVISFTLAWPTESKEVRLSVFGHVEDTRRWLNVFSDRIPISDSQIGQWLENVGEWLSKECPKAEDEPPLAEIAEPTGVFWIQRRALSQDIKSKPYLSEEHMALMFGLEIPHTEERLIQAIQSNQIHLAVAFLVGEAECSKCKKDYKNCMHSKYLDPGVHVKLRDLRLVYAFWTDKKA